MAKKKSKSADTLVDAPGVDGQQRGAKSNAVRDYLKRHPDAKPKEVVATLAEQGIVVSHNLVSILRAKAKIRKARRSENAPAAAPAAVVSSTAKSAGLESALLLYKAARGQQVPAKHVTQAFLSLVELLS